MTIPKGIYGNFISNKRINISIILFLFSLSLLPWYIHFFLLRVSVLLRIRIILRFCINAFPSTLKRGLNTKKKIQITENIEILSELISELNQQERYSSFKNALKEIEIFIEKILSIYEKSTSENNDVMNWILKEILRELSEIGAQCAKMESEDSMLIVVDLIMKIFRKYWSKLFINKEVEYNLIIRTLKELCILSIKKDLNRVTEQIIFTIFYIYYFHGKSNKPYLLTWSDIPGQDEKILIGLLEKVLCLSNIDNNNINIKKCYKNAIKIESDDNFIKRILINFVFSESSYTLP